MQVSEMKVGRSVDIFILREGYNYRLGSKIEEVRNGVVYITLITSKNRVFQFRQTDEIVVIYKTENRLFKWTKVTGGIGNLDGDVVHVLYMTGEGKPYNRRATFRVPFEESVVCERYVLKEGEYVSDEETEVDPETDERFELKQFTSFVNDLSANGVGLFTNEPLEIGDEFTFEIHSPYGKMFFAAEVQRIADERKNAMRRFYGCSFTKSNEELPKYLYDLQRLELRKKRGR